MLKFERLENKIVIKFLFIKITKKFTLEKENKIIKKLIPFIRLLDKVVPKQNNKIVFCFTYSNIGASYAYYRYLKENCSDKYKICIVTNKIDKNVRFENLSHIYTFKGAYDVLTSKYAVSTNCNITADFFNSDKRKYLFFFHGMPIKKVGFSMDKLGESLVKYGFFGKYADFFVTSDLFKLIMTVSFNANYKKVHITGSPRNDLIGNTEHDEKLKEIFNFEQFNKVMLYMPTFKARKKSPKSQMEKEFNNIFYLDDYNEDDFVRFLEENNILFIMKPHPVAEFFYKKNPKVLPKSNNFKVVYNDDFYKHNIQPYEMYKFVDVMVGDYSSAALDYLVLNRPVIYITSLAEDYGTKRGLILDDNYGILMPGVKVVTYNDFKEQMFDSITKDSFKNEREKLLPLINKYRDFNSCERVYEVMKNL